jgi:hypothetical protein
MSILRIWHLDKSTSVTEMTQYDTSAGPVSSTHNDRKRQFKLLQYNIAYKLKSRVRSCRSNNAQKYIKRIQKGVREKN